MSSRFLDAGVKHETTNGSSHEVDEAGPERSAEESETAEPDPRMLVEVICERAHCVIYEYAIITVKFIADEFKGRVKVKPVVRRGSKKNVDRYLELCRINGQHLSVPAILMDGQLVFTYVPGPGELRQALQERLAEREKSREQAFSTVVSPS